MRTVGLWKRAWSGSGVWGLGGWAEEEEPSEKEGGEGGTGRR